MGAVSGGWSFVQLLHPLACSVPAGRSLVQLLYFLMGAVPAGSFIQLLYPLAGAVSAGGEFCPVPVPSGSRCACLWESWPAGILGALAMAALQSQS